MRFGQERQKGGGEGREEVGGGREGGGKGEQVWSGVPARSRAGVQVGEQG